MLDTSLAPLLGGRAGRVMKLMVSSGVLPRLGREKCLKKGKSFLKQTWNFLLKHDDERFRILLIIL